MPFSMVLDADTNSLQWLATLPDRAELFAEMRPAQTPQLRTALRRAKTSANLALAAIAQGKAPEAVAAAMWALQAAWLIEGHGGFFPRVRKANAAQAQRKVAARSASAERGAEASAHRKLARELAAAAPPRIRGQGIGAIAKHVQRAAGQRADQAGQHIAGLSPRQVQNLIR